MEEFEKQIKADRWKANPWAYTVKNTLEAIALVAIVLLMAQCSCDCIIK